MNKITQISIAIFSLAVTSVLANPPAPGTYSDKVPIAYQHKNSPFSASVGICLDVRGSYDMSQQMPQIAANFKMLHLYQLDQKTMDYAQSQKMEVLLGTLTSVAQEMGDASTGYSAAQTYVNTISKYAKAGTIKAICIGNEPNAGGNPGCFVDEDTFDRAAKNLDKALKAEGLTNIPVTVNLVFGATQNGYPPNNVTFLPAKQFDGQNVHSPLAYINSIQALNPTKAFVFFDLYPYWNWGQGYDQYCLGAQGGGPNGQCCGMIDAQYLSACNATYKAYPNVEVYIAETGWPNANPPGPSGSGTSSNQAAFVNNFYSYWIEQQSGTTIPVFLFYAFPNAGETVFSLFDNSSIDFSQYKKENGK